MESPEKTYIVYPVRDDSKPFIDHEGQGCDWNAWHEYMKGERSLSDYKPVNITVKHKDALRYDYYHFSNSMGLLSKKAIDVLGEDMLANYETLPVILNGAPYFAITLKTETDCLDVENSVYVKVNETETDFLSIAHYAFHWDKIELDRWFSVPQFNIYILCTERVAEKIRGTDLMGFEFIHTSVDRA